MDTGFLPHFLFVFVCTVIICHFFCFVNTCCHCVSFLPPKHRLSFQGVLPSKIENMLCENDGSVQVVAILLFACRYFQKRFCNKRWRKQKSRRCATKTTQSLRCNNQIRSLPIDFAKTKFPSNILRRNTKI